MTPQDKNQLELPVSEEAALTRPLEVREKRDFPESLITLAKRKRFIIYFVASAAVLSAVVSLILPKSWTATARMLPPQQSQSVAAAMLGELGQLAPLLNMGKDLALRNPNDLYVEMLRSETVANALVDRFQLMSLYHQKLRGDARSILRLRSSIVAEKNGLISISVDDRDPQRAADIANAYIEELDKLTKKLAITDAAKRRIFFEREAKVTNDELGTAEEGLKQTEEKTGVIELSSQAKAAIEGFEALKAAATAKEVEIQTMRSFATPDNPELVMAENELAALRAQIAAYEKGHGGPAVGDPALEKIPAKQLEYLRALREVKYRQALLELMLKQYEIARLDEAKDSSLVQVLDKALPPEKRSWPKRTAIVLASTLLALMIAVVVALLAEKLQRIKEDPQFAAQFQLFRFYLRGGHKS